MQYVGGVSRNLGTRTSLTWSEINAADVSHVDNNHHVAVPCAGHVDPDPRKEAHISSALDAQTCYSSQAS
jgi:hypothetical protein